jgi:ABC-type lipoprotein export system ATPase subunit
LGDTTIHTLNAVDIDINEGELVVLKGDSGSGEKYPIRMQDGTSPPASSRTFIPTDGSSHHLALNDFTRWMFSSIGKARIAEECVLRKIQHAACAGR